MDGANYHADMQLGKQSNAVLFAPQGQPLFVALRGFLDAGGLIFATLFGCAGQVETGKPVEECRKQVFMLDSKGLVCKSRLHELQHHKINFAHDAGEMDYTCPCHTLGTGVELRKNSFFWFASRLREWLFCTACSRLLGVGYFQSGKFSPHVRR